MRWYDNRFGKPLKEDGWLPKSMPTHPPVSSNAARSIPLIPLKFSSFNPVLPTSTSSPFVQFTTLDHGDNPSIVISLIGDYVPGRIGDHFVRGCNELNVTDGLGLSHDVRKEFGFVFVVPNEWNKDHKGDIEKELKHAGQCLPESDWHKRE